MLKFNYVAMNAIEVAALMVLGHSKYEKFRMTDRQTCFYLGSYTKKVH